MRKPVDHSFPETPQIIQREKGGLAKSGPCQLDWLDSLTEEIEAHLLPLERAIVAALRAYREQIE